MGTSGWSYEHWVGKFYPNDLQRSQWLVFYSKYFNTVEINMSFYRFPYKNMLKGWYNKTPRNFKFTMKAHRQITHVKKLVNVKRLLNSYYSLAKELGEKFGCMLFQMPPSFKNNENGFKRLEKFLNQLNNEFNNVIEFRHKSWFCKEVFKLLRENNAIFCIVSAPRLPDVVEKTSKIAYIRFHGAGSWYASNYSKNELKNWAKKIKELKAKEIYCYFNNDYNAYAVENCKELKRILK